MVPRKRSGPPVLRRIDTSPIGFAVFDQVLLTVHPPDCAARDAYATRLLAAASASAETRAANVDPRLGGARLPASPSDLMLRIVNQIVDGYLALRRDLSSQLDHWQAELLDPRTRFSNWSALLEARMALHQLDDICEDQRTAVLDWTEAVKGWPVPDNADARHEHELLMVRSRDVLEHIERVVRHVTRLEHNAETAVHRRDDGPAVLAQALPGAHRALKAEGTHKKARRRRAFLSRMTREGSHHCGFAAVCIPRASALDSLGVNRGTVHCRGHRRQDIRARRMEIAGG